jgi:hypothetical protein
MLEENVSFEVEFQLLDNVMVTEKQQEWKRKFVSMDFMRLIRRALDKLSLRDSFWNDYKCFQRVYGLTILSDDEHKHLSLYPLATAPCNENCLLFHQYTGRFQDWFTLEQLIELSEAIQQEMEYFLHKKIPTFIKYPILSNRKNAVKNIRRIQKPIIQILREQEEEGEPQLPEIIGDKMEIDMDDF